LDIRDQQIAQLMLNLFQPSSPIILVFDPWRRYPIPRGTPLYPPNSPKMGVNRQFQAKRAKYKNRDISQNTNTINMQF